MTKNRQFKKSVRETAHNENISYMSAFRKASSQEHQAKIISVIGTGGIGKTTLSLTIAQALSEQGHKVALFDYDLFDGQLPLFVNAKKSTVDEKFITQDQVDKEYIHRIGKLTFDVFIPSKNTKTPDETQIETFYKRFINTVKGSYDFIIVDTGATVILPFSDVLILLHRSYRSNTESMWIESIQAGMDKKPEVITVEAPSLSRKQESTYPTIDMDITVIKQAYRSKDFHALIEQDGVKNILSKVSQKTKIIAPKNPREHITQLSDSSLFLGVDNADRLTVPLLIAEHLVSKSFRVAILDCALEETERLDVFNANKKLTCSHVDIYSLQKKQHETWLESFNKTFKTLQKTYDLVLFSSSRNASTDEKQEFLRMLTKHMPIVFTEYGSPLTTRIYAHGVLQGFALSLASNESTGEQKKLNRWEQQPDPDKEENASEYFYTQLLKQEGELIVNACVLLVDNKMPSFVNIMKNSTVVENTKMCEMSHTLNYYCEKYDPRLRNLYGVDRIFTLEEENFLLNVSGTVLIAGGTCTGKTGIARSIADMYTGRNKKVCFISSPPEENEKFERESSNRNIVFMKQPDENVKLSTVVRAADLLCPDGIIVDEVRSADDCAVTTTSTFYVLHALSLKEALVRSQMFGVGGVEAVIMTERGMRPVLYRLGVKK